jgi:hypothetical protein
MKYKTNKSIFTIILIIVSLGMVSCSGFLDYTPKGTVTKADLNTPQAAEKLEIAAYASLGNSGWGNPIGSMWVWGSIRSDEAYKGGGSITDQGQYNKYEQFNLITTDMHETDLLWNTLFAGVARANEALRVIDKLSASEYPKKVERQAEMRFLRGHFYFLLKEIFKWVPYADETVSSDSLVLISNRKYSNEELWNKIAGDFKFAANHLPANQSDVGRPTKYAAEAYLAKVRLYEAYEQKDANNQVIGLNKKDLKDVVKLTGDIIQSGKYHLDKHYAENFTLAGENGPESIFAIQYSIKDGTKIGRVNMDDGLNYPVSSLYGCCSFHIPSQTLINAYKTDSNGLPEFGYFNKTSLLTESDYKTNDIDPRLDHTAGIVGHPFKYQPNVIYDSSWARTPQIYGYHSPMKEILPANSPGLKKYSAFFGSSKNIDIIRYDDVLLWRAEALIKLGRQSEALPLINKIRKRAANSTARLKLPDGNFASNYKISTYKPGINCHWTQSYAFKALKFERRLEFGMEGSRLFDLVRWGIAGKVLNNYFSVESKRHDFLSKAHFAVGRDEYLPIPQEEINLTHGLYQQNPGW